MPLARRATAARHRLLLSSPPRLVCAQISSYSTKTPSFDSAPSANEAFKTARKIRLQAATSKASLPTTNLAKLKGYVDDIPADTRTAEDISITSPSGKEEKVQLQYNKDSLFFVDIEGTQAVERFPVEQLRDACSCHLCRDVSSGQKSFSTTEIPSDLEIQNVEWRENGALAVTIAKDMSRIGGDLGHDIILDAESVQMLSNTRLRNWSKKADHSHRFHVDYWDREYIQQHVRKIDYEDFMKTDSLAFWDVMQDIMRLGIVFLKNVPRDENSVVHIAERINCIRETFYGRTFDVRAKPNAENVAYTSGYLGLHQDLLYLEPMPYIQILHCIDNNCHGGESLFSDADRIARIMQNLPKQDPQYEYLVKRLSEVAIPYAYNKDGKNYHQARPVINNDPQRGFQSVRWSPPFQGKIHDPERLDHWIAAARVFEKAVNHEDAMYQTKMTPGECVLFNNQRVLHGRTAFDSAGGARWLRGTYLSFEDFWSTASYAPASHAAGSKDRARWWRPEVADEMLSGTDMAGRVKGWLGEEMAGLRDYSKNGGLPEGPKREKMSRGISEALDASIPDLTKRIRDKRVTW